MKMLIRFLAKYRNNYLESIWRCNLLSMQRYKTEVQMLEPLMMWSIILMKVQS